MFLIIFGVLLSFTNACSIYDATATELGTGNTENLSFNTFQFIVIHTIHTVLLYELSFLRNINKTFLHPNDNFIVCLGLPSWMFWNLRNLLVISLCARYFCICMCQIFFMCPPPPAFCWILASIVVNRVIKWRGEDHGNHQIFFFDIVFF